MQSLPGASGGTVWRIQRHPLAPCSGWYLIAHYHAAAPGQWAWRLYL